MNIEYVVIFHGTDCKTKSHIKQLFKNIVNKLAKYKIKKYLKNQQIDIVHNNSVLSLVSMEAAYDLDIPYICHVRESIESDLGLEMVNYDKLYFLMQNSSYCVYISNTVKKRYINYVNCNNVVIFDGIDTDKYILKKDLKNINFKKLILVGRIARGKGQMDAVESIQVLINKYKSEYYLTLIGSIGDINYYNEINDYIKEKKLGKYVNILPYSDKLSELRKEHGIALICSENEGLGRVTVEAMLSRQLIIGANCGATKELIKDGINGYLYELHNTENLANIIKNIDKVRSLFMINNAYKFALDNFDNEKETEKILKLYDEILRR